MAVRDMDGIRMGVVMKIDEGISFVKIKRFTEYKQKKYSSSSNA